MKQGRKSKTVLALFCTLASLLALCALAPAASAQGPAESEYDLGPLPGAGGDNPAAGAEPAATADAGSGDESSGGSASTLLIGLVAVAAVCTGLAIWRLRRGDDVDDDPRIEPTTGERQSV